MLGGQDEPYQELGPDWLARRNDEALTRRLVAQLERLGRLTLHLADGAHLTCRVAVNCAGLHADTIARLVGDDSLEVYLRKGEFFAFELPDGATLDRIPLPVPTPRTKGVLVFPTVDGRGVADPTAVDQEAKDDWTVRPDAATEILENAVDGAPPSRASSPWPATRASGRPDAESTT